MRGEFELECHIGLTCTGAAGILMKYLHEDHLPGVALKDLSRAPAHSGVV